MRFIIGGLVAATLMFGTVVPRAEAGIFDWAKPKDKRVLPKPIDYPMVRPKLKETHKLTGQNLGRHPVSPN